MQKRIDELVINRLFIRIIIKSEKFFYGIRIFYVCQGNHDNRVSI